MNNIWLTIAAILFLLFLFYQSQTNNQIGGEEDVISTNAITESDISEADIRADTAAPGLAAGDYRNADLTDANLSRSDVNTIALGPGYVAADHANTYLTGSSVDGLGSYTIDGAARVQGRPDPRRINPLGPIRPGRVIEANSWSLQNYRPRTNDRVFRIQKSGLRQLDVLQVFDMMGRTSFVLRLKGSLPSGCAQLRILPVRLDPFNNIRVVIYSIVDPFLLCTQEIRPFEVNIALDPLPRGRYNVLVNNRPVTGLVQN